MSADVVPARGHRASKLSVVGAGSVGTSLAYAALIRGSADLISLYDINDKLVEAQVRDLSHGTQFTPSLITGGSDLNVTNGSDVVVVTAGARQLRGQTRLELAAANTRLLEKIMPDLLAHSPHALFVLVTNPCDVLTVVARQVTGLPSGRVLSSGTMLDTSRLRYLIAQKINVSQRNVHATIMGEHGDSEFPAWSNASINQVPIRDWMIDGKRVFTDDVLAGLARSAVNAAYAVIEGKGATNYAIGLAGARLVEALLSPTRTVLPVSSVLDDYYGISGIALSVPTLIGARGVEEVLQIPLQPNEVEALHSSADALREALSGVGY